MLRRTMAAVERGPQSQQLAGKRVAVTGASSGIGQAIAKACAAAGADVVISYRSNRSGAEATERAVSGFGRRAVMVQGDIAEGADIQRMVERAFREFGEIDAWINNAGADILTGPAASFSRIQKLDMLLRVDLRGTMLASWAVGERMQRQPHGGTIINMSWDGVLRGLEGENPELFSAAKGGILSFSKSLARSLAPEVRVNIIGPGYIETAFGETAKPEWKERVRQSIPLGRWGTPEDVAGVAVFLASDAARYLTGQMIMVNGGEVM